MSFEVLFRADFDGWRRQARALLERGRSPDEVVWCPQDEAQGSLAFAPVESDHAERAVSVVRVPKAFVEDAQLVATHRDARRWSLMYRILWRLNHEGSHLLQVSVDDDVWLFQRLARQVGRDLHKMHAFVRFRQVQEQDNELGKPPLYLAWHAPDHAILRLAAPFFQRRFAAMRWSIMTPDDSVYWDGTQLVYGPGCRRERAPQVEDRLEELWLSYYASIFNPARIKLKMMRQEMPVRHWRTLPETAVIDQILADAPQRVEAMLRQQPVSIAQLVPAGDDLGELRAAAATCRGCDLCHAGTQTVFGVGPGDAKIMLVGEQPGDEEDVSGSPLVGPAGQLLNKILLDAGVDRASLYLTNAVKHFRHQKKDKRRLHQRPESRHIAACKPWLEAELRAVKPRILVCLGATAAQSVLGRLVRLEDERGRWQRTAWTPWTLVTVHPAAILRTVDPVEREASYLRCVQELTLCRDTLKAKAMMP